MSTTKQQIRTDMKGFLGSLSAMDRHARSLAACELLQTTKEFRHAQLVMIFLSMATEIETAALAVKAWQDGKTVVVPRMDWTRHRMEPIEIRSLDVGVRETHFGVKEPVAGNPVPLAMIDLVVIPGLAFDRNGYRVGRGRGFYDRFLSQDEFKGKRVGLCFHEQILEAPIPAEPHDIAMNLVVSDREIIRSS